MCVGGGVIGPGATPQQHRAGSTRRRAPAKPAWQRASSRDCHAASLACFPEIACLPSAAISAQVCPRDQRDRSLRDYGAETWRAADCAIVGLTTVAAVLTISTGGLHGG
jgi:hypothetical protein